jgi:hypothetical protein
MSEKGGNPSTKKAQWAETMRAAQTISEEKSSAFRSKDEGA